MPGGAQPTPGLPRIGDTHIRERAAVQAVTAAVARQVIECPLADDSHCARVHCPANETMAVHVHARDGDEQVAGAYPSRIGGNAVYLDVAARLAQNGR